LTDNPQMPEASESSGRLYTAVIVIEVITIAALWLFGRLYA
jgi:hypothetical protein